MTRSHPAWLAIGFAIALVAVGFRYWQLPLPVAGMAHALWGPGLAAVAVVAMMLRAFGVARFWKVALLIAVAAPVAVLLPIAVHLRGGPAIGASWTIDVLVAAALGLLAALLGTGIGSLFLLRSSKRPA